MTTPRYSRTARADLAAIADHIARDNPTRARSFIRELRDHCRLVARQPKVMRLREEFGADVRAAIHADYLILYTERDGQVFIERVVHGARDLGVADR